MVLLDAGYILLHMISSDTPKTSNARPGPRNILIKMFRYKFFTPKTYLQKFCRERKCLVGILVLTRMWDSFSVGGTPGYTQNTARERDRPTHIMDERKTGRGSIKLKC